MAIAEVVAGYNIERDRSRPSCHIGYM